MAQTAKRSAQDKQAVICSEAFKSGYDAGFENTESTGWHIDAAPEEQTLVETMRTMAHILASDKFEDYEVRWCCGLLAGWFARGHSA